MLVLREMYRPFATKMDRQQWCSRVIHVVRHPDLLSYSEPHWLLVLYQFWHGDYTMSRNLLRPFPLSPPLNRGLPSAWLGPDTRGLQRGQPLYDASQQLERPCAFILRQSSVALGLCSPVYRGGTMFIDTFSAIRKVQMAGGLTQKGPQRGQFTPGFLRINEWNAGAQECESCWICHLVHSFPLFWKPTTVILKIHASSASLH